MGDVPTCVYAITPVGAPRMTQRDQWKRRPAVLRYFAFRDRVRELGVTLPEAGAHITFVIPMPPSWSAKKRAAHDGQPHRQKPDLDNCVKALADSVFDEDCQIHDYRVTKRWGTVGMIIVGQVE